MGVRLVPKRRDSSTELRSSPGLRRSSMISAASSQAILETSDGRSCRSATIARATARARANERSSFGLPAAADGLVRVSMIVAPVSA
jgi:hypothetical protein